MELKEPRLSTAQLRQPTRIHSMELKVYSANVASVEGDGIAGIHSMELKVIRSRGRRCEPLREDHESIQWN